MFGIKSLVKGFCAGSLLWGAGTVHGADFAGAIARHERNQQALAPRAGYRTIMAMRGQHVTTVILPQNGGIPFEIDESHPWTPRDDDRERRYLAETQVIQGQVATLVAQQRVLQAMVENLQSQNATLQVKLDIASK